MQTDTEKRPLIIIGAGGHSVSVANVAISAGYKIRCFIDSSKFGSNIFGYDILKDITEIRNLDERIVDNKFINFTILKDENEINIFFNKKNFNLIGWQTLDIYQNLNITYLSSLKKNQNINQNIFKLPPVN